LTSADVFFYGNKLFQSEFISVILPDNDSILPGWLYNMINIGVSLVGYYLASFLIDNKLYGRKHMQTLGFLMDFVFFVIPAFHLDYYTSPAHIKEFQTMYFLSSFFNQFGPNSVTFLAAAEVYPTAVRATAHGFSAACGKLGALTAAVLYNYIDTQTKFYVVPWFGLAGVVLTVVFMPDTTGLDLKEQERRWAFIRAGREKDYHGVAVHPKHLSLWERLWGIGKAYDAELDYKQRVEEMREEWETMMQRKYDEKEGKLDHDDVYDDEWHDDARHYFHRTTHSPNIRGMEKEKEGGSESSGGVLNGNTNGANEELNEKRAT
jgi:hypothetical protein